MEGGLFLLGFCFCSPIQFLYGERCKKNSSAFYYYLIFMLFFLSSQPIVKHSFFQLQLYESKIVMQINEWITSRTKNLIKKFFQTLILAGVLVSKKRLHSINCRTKYVCEWWSVSCWAHETFRQLGTEDTKCTKGWWGNLWWVSKMFSSFEFLRPHYSQREMKKNLNFNQEISYFQNARFQLIHPNQYLLNLG